MRWNARLYQRVEYATPRPPPLGVKEQYEFLELFISAKGRTNTGFPDSAIASASPIRCASPLPSAIALGVKARPAALGMQCDVRAARGVR